MPRLTKEERADVFVSKVRKVTDCWIWTGSTNSDGYGTYRFDGHTRAAHRVAYELHVGPISPGMSVCHKCDVRLCVNPGHLFLGTHTENMRDMNDKGRQLSPGAFGPRNGATKITAEQADEIRALYATGQHSQAALGRQFGVSQTHVGHIIRNTRRNIPDPLARALDASEALREARVQGMREGLDIAKGQACAYSCGEAPGLEIEIDYEAADEAVDAAIEAVRKGER